MTSASTSPAAMQGSLNPARRSEGGEHELTPFACCDPPAPILPPARDRDRAGGRTHRAGAVHADRGALSIGWQVRLFRRPRFVEHASPTPYAARFAEAPPSSVAALLVSDQISRLDHHNLELGDIGRRSLP